MKKLFKKHLREVKILKGLCLSYSFQKNVELNTIYTIIFTKILPQIILIILQYFQWKKSYNQSQNLYNL